MRPGADGRVARGRLLFKIGPVWHFHRSSIIFIAPTGHRRFEYGVGQMDTRNDSATAGCRVLVVECKRPP